MEAYIVEDWYAQTKSLWVFERTNDGRAFFYLDENGYLVQHQVREGTLIESPKVKPLLKLEMYLGDEIFKAIAKAITGKDLEVMQKVTDRSIDAFTMLKEEHSKLDVRFDLILDTLVKKLKP